MLSRLSMLLVTNWNSCKGEHYLVISRSQTLYLKVWFFCELLGFSWGKVIVGKGGVQSRDEMEQSFPVYRVAERSRGLVLWARAAREMARVARVARRRGVAAVAVRGRGQRLQRARRPAVLARKLLVQLLLRGDHLTRVTLDPNVYKIDKIYLYMVYSAWCDFNSPPLYSRIPNLHEKRRVQHFKGIIFKQFHLCYLSLVTIFLFLISVRLFQC